MTDEGTAQGIEDTALAAHAAWVSRGRTGEGRLLAKDRAIGGDLRGADLRGAEFEGCTFERALLSGAQLDGARFRRCRFGFADLRRASILDARFEDCDLRRALVAGTRIGRTGFLRCAFGDFGSQPIGRPDVRGPYLVVGPDVSARADGSRIGTAADIDGRWFNAGANGDRTFPFVADTGDRLVAQVLHMHVRWAREAGPRFQDVSATQTFSQFLADGPPGVWAAMPEDELAKARALVAGLASAWAPPSPA